MPRCELTGKKPVVKNLVSHSNIKTKSRAFPNVCLRTFHSSVLKRSFRLKVAASTLRTIDKYGGIDLFLMSQSKTQLSPQALKLRNKMEKKMQKGKNLENKNKKR